MKTTAPSVVRAERNMIRAYLATTREIGARLLRRESSSADPTYREILDAIHRPAR